MGKKKISEYKRLKGVKEKLQKHGHGPEIDGIGLNRDPM